MGEPERAKRKEHNNRKKRYFGDVQERKMAETLTLRGTLEGHEGWVTAIATPLGQPNSDILLSASRDKTVILWKLTRDEESFGYPMRLWDLNTGTTTRRFLGHTKDVLSVAFSSDNRQIMSGSRDKTIKLWNTLGECKYTIQDQDGHSEW